MKMTAEDKKWEVESDARTLREAEEIKVDSGRFKKAAAELKKQAEAARRAVLLVNAKKGLKKAFSKD